MAAAGGWLISRTGRVDRPGARSSHVRPTRTGGGVAIAAGVAAAAAWAGIAQAAAGVQVALDGALLMAALGAVDDGADIDAGLKLALGVAVALAVAALEPPLHALPLWPGVELPLAPAVAAAGAALWLVTSTNAVNFMDGANGLVPGGLPIAFGALALAAWRSDPAAAAVSALAAAGWLGFLPWNLAGRLFQGDAGSLFGGFLLAALGLETAGRGALPLLFTPLALLPWLTDVLLTLLRRARGRRPLLQAHREHLYQRWLQAMGKPHAALAWRDALIIAAADAAALLAGVAPRWQALVFAPALAACVAAWTFVSRRLDGALSKA